MVQSEGAKQLMAALVGAQADFKTLPKDKKGYNYRYTDLDTVVTLVRPVLAKHGLGFLQSPSMSADGKMTLTTRLFSKDGEWLEDTTPIPDFDLAGGKGGKANVLQSAGAAITYMKRYALCAMLGISSDEDTDGAEWTKPETKGDQQQKPQPFPKTEESDRLAQILDEYIMAGTLKDAYKQKAEYYMAQNDVRGMNSTIAWCKSQQGAQTA